MSTIQCKFCASPLPKNSLLCTHCKQRNPISPLYKQDIYLDNIEVIEVIECIEWYAVGGNKKTRNL